MATLENGNTVEGQNKTNGKITSTRESKPKVNSIRWMFGIVARLLIWYTILTPFIYCPSDLSELGKDSSRICKPYLITRSHLDPHISPIYQTYAAPYVDIAKPYYDTFNEKVYTPTAKFTKDNYAVYGAPRLEKARVYGSEQWELIAVPRLHLARDTVTDLYNTSIEPHKRNVVSIITPYYATARERAYHLHEAYILPSYVQTKPIVSKAYVSGHDVLASTVFPYVQKVWILVMNFMDTAVLPRVTGLYSQNVEPQLIRISEKLASYREGRKLRAAVDEVDNSVEASSSTTVTSATSGQISDSKGSSVTEADPTTTPLSPEEQKEQAKEKISTDLKTWQEKFSVAADKGSDDLKERIQEIVGSQLESGAITYGESLVLALEKTANEELHNLKTKTNEIVEELSEACTVQEEENAHGKLLDAVRSSGIAIRDKAHSLREWYNNFDSELLRRASAASDSTLDVLDNIRNLGLQEIGMRWAWMDGVTYKDWAKYHALKKQFAEWRKEVRDVGMEHEALKNARSTGSDVLSHGMSIAEGVARELSRLKEIGKWKIEARDSSEDFTDRTSDASSVREEKGIPSCTVAETQSSETAAAENAEQPADTGFDDESIDTDQEEPDDHQGERIPDSSSIWGGAAAESMTNQDSTDLAEEQLETASEPAGSIITSSDSAATSTSGILEHITSIASSRLQEGLSLASAELSNAKATLSASADPSHQQILMDAQRRYYEALGMAHDRYSIFLDSASEAVFATATSQETAPTEDANLPKFEDLVSEAQAEFSTVSSLASASSNAVVVSVNSAISSMDEEDAQSIVSDVSSRYNAAVSAASASLTSALSAASVMSESASAEATATLGSGDSQDWRVLVSKASELVYSTPTSSEQAAPQESTKQADVDSDITHDSEEPNETETEANAEPTIDTASDATESTSSASPEVETSTEALPAVETLLNAVSEAVDAIVDSAQEHEVQASDDRNAVEAEIEDAKSKLEAVGSAAQTVISSAIYEPVDSTGATPDSEESSVLEQQKESALESAQSQVEEFIEKAEARLDEQSTEQSTETPASSEAVSSATTTDEEPTSDTSVASTEAESTARDEL
ncbi:hypothetical protein FQN54_000771 [Arachnomyces sp. PD_36]|nr:hypothetical protein FQN54_000771 [Arachnomyces sp. PD_36]